MAQHSELKLIDLLSLRPGSLLHLHTVKGEPACTLAEQLLRCEGWKEEISHAAFPEGDDQTRHNFSKLLDIPIDTQVIVRHPADNVVEILRLNAAGWHDILSRVGYHVDVMVDGRIFASGEIVDTQNESGIRIEKMAAL